MAPRPRHKVVALDAHRQAMRDGAGHGEHPGVDGAADETVGAALRGLKQAQQKAREADTLLQTAVGALHDIRLLLQRMRALAMLGADVSLTASARQAVQAQLNELVREVDRHATHTAFNRQTLLDGRLAAGVTLHVSGEAGQAIAFAIAPMTPAALGLLGGNGGDGFSVGAEADARRAVSTIEAAIEVVSTQKAELGAVIERLDVIIVNLHVGAENVSAIMSRITDRDMAMAVTNILKAQIYHQPATALQAQAQALQGILVQFPVPPAP
jgi:flagellin